LQQDATIVQAVKSAVGKVVALSLIGGIMNQVEKELENLFVLSSHVRVYVPTTVDVDQVADTSDQVDDIKRCLAEWFGGATAYSALGSWVTGAGSLVEEKVTIVEAFCTEEQLSDHITDVLNQARHLKQALRQEAIAIEIQHRLYFI
jgi:hypothetical protein